MDTTQVIRELEKKGEQQLKNILAQPTAQAPHMAPMIANIICTGAAEFKEKTGREMTYSEMRDAYG